VVNLKQYVVVLIAKPSARLPQNLGKLELNFTDPTGPKKLLIAKIEEESAGTIVQTGISFRVFIDSENITKAINSAKSFVDGIASFITLLTGRGMEIPLEEIAYELTPDEPKREFRQIFYDVPLKNPSRRQVDPQKLADFIDKTLKIKPPYSEHISRAIRWYRLGATVTDPFDQFNSFWIGLEALNPLLQQKFSIKDDTARCPKCKHEWIATPTVSGIRAFIQGKMNGEKHLYRNIRQLRIDIMHSTKRLSELIGLVTTNAPRTGEVLFRAICFLLEFEDWNVMKHGAILREFPVRGELHAFLVGGNPMSLGANGQDPHFKLGHNLRKIESKENEKVSFTIDTSITAQLNNGVQFERVELWFYGDSETPGEILNSSFKKAEAIEEKQDKNTKLDFEIVDVISGQEDWSIYRLMDGTIFKIRLALVKALRQDNFDSSGNPNYVLNTQTILGAVPAKNSWGKPSLPYTQEELQSSIVHKDLKFETLQEPWNQYLLDDGTKVQIRTALTTVSKTDKYGFNGEPVYIVNWVSNTKTDVPDELRKRV
jgi:hypothetical protein